MSSPLDILHTLIVLSSDPDAKYSPFGEYPTQKTKLEWPVSVFMRSPLDILHTTIVFLPNPDVKNYPLGENTMLPTYE